MRLSDVVDMNPGRNSCETSQRRAGPPQPWPLYPLQYLEPKTSRFRTGRGAENSVVGRSLFGMGKLTIGVQVGVELSWPSHYSPPRCAGVSRLLLQRLTWSREEIALENSIILH